MSTEQLKQILLSENLKDKKRTFSFFTIIYLVGIGLLAFPIVLLYLISIYAGKFDFLSPFNFFPEIVSLYKDYTLFCNVLFLIITVGILFHLFCQIKKKTQSKKEIERLINCLEDGAKSHTVEETTRYKLYFSFSKKEIKMIPFQNLYVIMNNDNRPFMFPISNEKINSIKLGITQ